MDQMGNRIKLRRKGRGLLIKDLSLKIGVTSSLISQIENGKAYPSIVTLNKIAQTLQTTVGDLIGENENLIQNPLLKVKDRRFVRSNTNGTSLYLLSYHDPSKQIEPYIIQFGKNSNSIDIMTSNFPGQEFCFVLKGSFEAHLNGESYLFNEGDGFYFNSRKKHLFKNTAEDDSELLWIINPLKN